MFIGFYLSSWEEAGLELLLMKNLTHVVCVAVGCL